LKRIIAVVIISTGMTLWGVSDREQIKALINEGKYNRAITLVALECTEKKDEIACKEIIQLYKKGYKEYHVNRNLKKMLYYAEISCKNGIARGCRAAGDLYWDAQQSEEAGVKQNLLKSVQYYKQACNAGDKGTSCEIGNDSGLIVSALAIPKISNRKNQIENILKAGYDVDAKRYGMTSLCAVTRTNNVELAKLLLEYDANPTVVCEIGGHHFNAFDIAKELEQRTGDGRMLELLKKYRKQ
jgi:TPR repeat protein